MDPYKNIKTIFIKYHYNFFCDDFEKFIKKSPDTVNLQSNGVVELVQKKDNRSLNINR